MGIFGLVKGGDENLREGVWNPENYCMLGLLLILVINNIDNDML